jgi:hypothetical protein
MVDGTEVPHIDDPAQRYHFPSDACTGLLWYSREMDGVAHLTELKPIPHAGL